MTKIVCDFCGNTATMYVREYEPKYSTSAYVNQSMSQGHAKYEADICSTCIMKLKQLPVGLVDKVL